MADKKVWLIFGATGELAADVPFGRWLPFDNDEAAKASLAFEGYPWAGIADTQGGKPRTMWTKADGWQSTTETLTAYGTGGKRELVIERKVDAKAE